MLHFIDTKNTRSQDTHEAKNPSDHRGDVAMPARWAQSVTSYFRLGAHFTPLNYRGEIAPVKPIYFRAIYRGPI